MYRPTNTIFPRLAYADEHAAIEWLTIAFGFVEQERKTNSDGSVLAWLELDGNALMVCRADYGLRGPTELGASTVKTVCYVKDVDAHYARATGAAATIERELETVPWGERRYDAKDPQGHHWHFTQRLSTQRLSTQVLGD